MSNDIRILVIDDHAVFRAGVVALIDATPGMTVVAEAADGNAGVDAFERIRPDVTLVDLVMPGLDGIAAIKAIRAIDPDARIVVLTTYGGDAQAHRALAAGAQAYLLKTSAGKELTAAIRSVHAGERSISAAVASDLAEYPLADILTDREIAILRGIAMGFDERQLAERHGLPVKSVEQYVSSAIGKLRASDRSHAVAIALKRGFLR